MAYTIAQENKGFFSKVKPLLKYIGAFLALVGIAYGVTVGMQKIFEIKQESAITVNVDYGKGVVFLDGKELGETPINKSTVKSGTHAVEVKSIERSDLVYFVNLDFNPATETSLFRDLGISDLFSSGKNFWLENGKTGLTVISQPSGASILIDGSEMGKTPITLDSLTPGSYSLDINYDGYEGQSASIEIKENFKLNVAAKLFPIPIPENATKFQESNNLYDLTITSETIANSPNRAKAVQYWISTRGAESGIPANVTFDYFIDTAGNVYNSNGDLVTDPEEFEKLKNAGSGGYLGMGAAETGLSEAAKESYLALFEGKRTGKILSTGVGWLRVRTSPSLNAGELTKVNVGETFPILEVNGDWVKIQISPEQSGWVSSRYIEISQ